LKRETSSVVGPKVKLKNYSRKTGRIRKHTGRSMTLFESAEGTDGSPAHACHYPVPAIQIFRERDSATVMLRTVHMRRVIAGKCGLTAERLLRGSHCMIRKSVKRFSDKDYAAMRKDTCERAEAIGAMPIASTRLFLN
jgi:hypothetical protein